MNKTLTYQTTALTTHKLQAVIKRVRHYSFWPGVIIYDTDPLTQCHIYNLHTFMYFKRIFIDLEFLRCVIFSFLRLPTNNLFQSRTKTQLNRKYIVWREKLAWVIWEIFYPKEKHELLTKYSFRNIYRRMSQHPRLCIAED